jgi:ABC-2 type transport system permease protein
LFMVQRCKFSIELKNFPPDLSGEPQHTATSYSGSYLSCLRQDVESWAANFEIKNMNLSIVDNDRSPYSTRLVQKVGASEYFHLIDVSNNYQEAMQCIEKGDADLILEIPPHFERDLQKTGVAKVLVSANTVNGTKGTLGSSYLSNIVNAYATEIRISHSGSISPSPVIKIDTQGRFNPYLDYKVFMVPALMAQLLMMLCGFLPALNIVSEKEFGTIEQINVTPVSKFTFILAKLIPYWVADMLILTISIILAWLVYGLVPAGHLWLLYFFALLFIIVISGMGLVVSNYSRTMQQTMFVMFFFVIIIMLMSGLFTPINSMPEWAQAITIANPLKYFIQVTRMVYLKGSGFDDLIMQFIALLFMAIMLNGWAVFSYKKNS